MSGKAASRKEDSLTDEQQSIIRKKKLEIDRLQKDISSLAKPLLRSDRSTPDWSKHVTPGTLSVFQEDTSWHRLDTNSEHKLGRRIAPLDPAATSWTHMQHMLDSFDEDHDESLSEGSASPTAPRFDASQQKTYGTMAINEDAVVVKCKTCERPILASSFQAHSEICGKAGKGNKKPRALTHLAASDKSKLGKEIFSDDDDDDDDDDGDDEPLAKRQSDTQHKKKQAKQADASSDALDPASIPAKRPPSSTTSEKPEKKKTKKDKAKQKGPKPKPPLDLDKQCGVIQGPNNTPCTRSLTCKSHSMGAKRAVAGRSQPYDVLLSAYQKKAIGRPQTTGAGAGDRKGAAAAAKGAKAATKKSQRQTAPASQVSTTTADAGGHDEQYVNSDEEMENVMFAVGHSRPAPLAERPFHYVKRRRQCYRLRDILLDAITPKSVSMGHSDSNNTLASLYNNSPTSHTSATGRSPLQPQQAHAGSFQHTSPSFSANTTAAAAAAAAAARFGQQTPMSSSAAGGLAGSPLSNAMFTPAAGNGGLQ